MRELSLHLLDLIENSIRANATIIRIRIEKNTAGNELKIKVEDNGYGMIVKPEEALNPFFTTKDGKRTGLGLSLFAEAVEEAEGKLNIEKSSLGGISVSATMKLTHINRKPLGDLAGSLSPLILAYPHLDIQLLFRDGEKKFYLSTRQVKKDIKEGGKVELIASERIFNKIKAIVSEFNI